MNRNKCRWNQLQILKKEGIFVISIGIDASKEKSMICAVKPYGEVRIVMEATVAYHLPILSKLQENGLFVCVVNPLLMKKYASRTLCKGKTDKMDSIKIAYYGLDNWFHLVNHQVSDEIYKELKILGRQYFHYIGMNVQGKNSLNNLLDRTMPKIKLLLKSACSEKPTKNKLIDFVETYWHYDNITSFSKADFILQYNIWAKEKGYHQSDSKAKAIYECACKSIPTLSSSMPSTKMLVLEAVKTYRSIAQTLETILAKMKELAKSLPEYPVVPEMNGVGEVLVVRLIAEIGNVTRFKSGKSLIAFAGIVSPPFESGNFVGTKRRISKRGSALLRKTGYEVMKCLKTVKPTTDNAVYSFILKKEAEGKPKKVAEIAGLNKFLRIYYARVSQVYQI